MESHSSPDSYIGAFGPLDSADLHGVGHPIFELIETGRHIKIYANGVVEGCESGAQIVNFIGLAVRPEFWRYYSKPQTNLTKSLGLMFGSTHDAGENLASFGSERHELAATGEK